MSNYNIHDLIEQAKYGDGAPAYSGDLQADMVAALEDVERLQDLVGLFLEAWPEAETFETVIDELMEKPKAAAAFDQIVKQTDATRLGLETEATALGVEI
jgi:hypothetical protein